MRDGGRFWLILGLVVAAGVGAWFWLHKPDAPPQPAAVSPPVAEPAPPPLVDAAPPAIQNPIEPAARHEGQLPSPDEADAFFEKALADLLGRKSVRAFFNVDGFVRRVVATVDNLATPVAAPQMWPVKPTTGRLAVDSQADVTAIAAKNAERYEPIVRLLDSVDTQRAVRLYRRAYPLLQQAYEDLGNPGAYFNDRVIELIDGLLATPMLPGPLAVKRLKVEGSTVPSHIYVFEDSALERSMSGQKILLRMGPANAARVKDKLTEVRALIARQRPR